MLSARLRSCFLVGPLMLCTIGCAGSGRTSGFAFRASNSAETQVGGVDRALGIARTFAKQGDLARAEQWYGRVVTSDPTNREAIAALDSIRNGIAPEDGTLLARRGELDRADEIGAANARARREARRMASRRSRSGVPDASPVEIRGRNAAVDGDDTSKTEIAAIERDSLEITDEDIIPEIRPATPAVAELSTTELVALLNNADDQQRSLGAFRLGERRAAAVEALPFIHTAMAAETNPSVRVHMAEAALKIDGSDEAASVVLVESLKSVDSDVRWLAAVGLESTAGRPSEAVCTALTERLADEDTTVRTAAAMTLGAFGTGAESAMPYLTALLDDADTEVREAAGVAITCIQASGTLASTTPAIESSDSLDSDPAAESTSNGVQPVDHQEPVIESTGTPAKPTETRSIDLDDDEDLTEL